MKKEIKYVVLGYVVLLALAYVSTLRFNSLNSVEDSNNQSRTIVLKLK